MTARDVCLSPAEWENALVQLQLAKQLGLIDDASPEALEARRQAKMPRMPGCKPPARCFTARGSTPRPCTCNMS